MWVPFLRPFPGNEAHKLFAGGPISAVSGGGQKVYVEKVYVPFLFPTSLPHTYTHTHLYIMINVRFWSQRQSVQSG